MLSRCFLDFSVGVGAFVIGLSQISSLIVMQPLYRKIVPLHSVFRSEYEDMIPFS